MTDKSNSKASGDDDDIVVIRKYANRRLYNTSASKYIVLADVVALIKTGVAFRVEDAKSGSDLTRSILAQIIFEQESQESDFLLSIDVQKQLIAFYGEGYSDIMSDYLSQSMGYFAREHQRLMGSMVKASRDNAQSMYEFGQSMMEQNMAFFQSATRAFHFHAEPAGEETAQSKQHKRVKARTDIQSEIDAVQARLDALKGD